MKDYRIVPASIRHVRPMSQSMRAAAMLALEAFGQDGRRALHRAFLASTYCRTAIIDGKPVAMWGIAGTLLNDVAYVWLVISRDIASMPLSIVRAARTELASIMADFREIQTTVLPEDEAAVRFAVYLGFGSGEEETGKSHRQAQHEILRNERYRVPVGDHYVIRLGYHPETRH